MLHPAYYYYNFCYVCRNKDRNAVTELSSPPGYSTAASLAHNEVSQDADPNFLIKKKSWDLALGPLKQVPMNLFIMYMAGNSISIFPMMMVGMLFVRPFKALLTTQGTFKMVEVGSAILQKLVYILGNIVNIGLALYKCQSMGLLPTHASDWLAFIEPQTRVEYSGGGFTLI